MSSGPEISACLIVKNESRQIESCLKSIRPHVQEICVVDTGSDDGTPEIVKKYADRFEVFTGCNDSEGRIESFADAREKSFELATKPWVMWIDGDDEVQGAERLPELVARHEVERNGGPALIMLPYEYSHDHLGNVTCLHYRERLVTPKDAFKWRSPVHEVLNPERSGTTMFQSDQVRIVHRRHASGKPSEPGRNLRILKAHYAKVGDSDIRLLYYLGLEYGNAGDLGNAFRFHKRYVELSGWDDEKFLACLKIAEHYQSLGQYDDAVQWALKCIIVREGWAEAYFSLSKSFYFMAQRGGPDERRNWERSVHYARLGLSMPPTKTILFINPLERSYEIHKFLNLALNKIGDVQGALDSANEALKVRPDDEGLRGNARLYEDFLARGRVRGAIDKLIELGTVRAEARAIVDDIVEGRFRIVSGQKEPQRAPEPQRVLVEQAPVGGTSGLRIALYVGGGCEPWNPDTVRETGIGGSETAAMEMARRLVARGHSVRLYGDCEHLGGTFDGVEYVHFQKFKDVVCDVLITSRRPHVVDGDFGVRARATVCWVHDIHLGPSLTHARALRTDRFLVLSNWHRDYFLKQHDFVHPDQVIVTRNGIDVSRFSPEARSGITRNPHRAVYSSSPDRGLDVAVRAWPKVRQRVPDAELHVFYGFKTWENSTSDPKQIDLMSYLKDQLESARENGVSYHGRVDQARLAREFLQSGVWAYPTWFSETSCITAMEAQAAGLRIVTSPIAALNETVGPRGTMIPGDWLSQEYMERWTDAVVDAMLRPGDEDRESLSRYAEENFGWDSLADEWSSMLARIVEEVDRDIVPPYKAAV